VPMRGVVESNILRGLDCHQSRVLQLLQGQRNVPRDDLPFTV